MVRHPAPDEHNSLALSTDETKIAVDRAGDRFLVNTVVEPPVQAPLTAVVNWQAAVR